jgi:hypothetical protein
MQSATVEIVINIHRYFTASGITVEMTWAETATKPVKGKKTSQITK